ncbi:MAG: MmcQ/YjbR family DNA-binding protein [Bacteroidetes bacterium]|nr:MAG: MmcQ/YjbR family DNA-binding protein [Bacteroidota bacterium]
MNIEDLRNYCLDFKGVTEEFPFDNKTLVFKVLGKMFALTDVDNFESVNLKCDPQYALELRERHQAVREGWHMNKKHWNTVSVHSDLNIQQIKDLIKHSYDLVVAKLNKNDKNKLANFS